MAEGLAGCHVWIPPIGGHLAGSEVEEVAALLAVQVVVMLVREEQE
jgi:hypothetical protein